jgi:hypothetical protein
MPRPNGPPVTATLQGRPLVLSRDLPSRGLPSRDLPSRDREGAVFTFAEEITLHAGEELVLLA